MRYRVLGLFLLGLSFPITAFAQSTANGSLRGFVKDEQLAVMPGVTLTATSPEAPGKYVAIADDQGYYRLLDLPPGTYVVVAELQGFATTVRENILVRAGLNLALDLVMRVGNQTETITVKADSPMLETRTAARSVNVSGEFQRSLPLASRRNWSEFLNLVPGVTTGAQSNEQYYLRGANVDEHVIRVDGVSIDSGFQGGIIYVKFNTDALQDVQVKTAGGEAASPLGLGAIIDVATPSGSNSPHGSATLAYQGQSWNDRNAPGSLTAVQQLQTDVSAGGPMLRDRAWFFGAHRYNDRQAGVSRTPIELSRLTALSPGFEPIDSANQAHFWFAKTTLRLNQRHQVSAWYQYDRNADNVVDPREAAHFMDRPLGGGATAARLNSVWTSDFTSQVLYSFTNKRFDRIPLRHDVPGRVIHATSFLSSGVRTGSGMIALLDNKNDPEQLTQYPKTSLAADLTYHRIGPVGAHELQTGLYSQFIDGLTEQRFFNDGFIVEDAVLNDPNNPAAGIRPFHRRIYDQSGLESFRGRSSNIALYAQDVWRPHMRITLSVGIRADLIRQYDDAFGVETVSSTEIGPRVGVNYLMTSDARNAVIASWARISSALTRTRLSVGTTAAAYRDVYDNDLDGTFETVFANPASTMQNPNLRTDPDYHQPYANEWAIGYRRQFGGQIAVNSSFVRREYRDRLAQIEVNGIYEGGLFRGYRNESSRDILLRTNNRWNWPVYSSLELEASKQSSRLQLLASYTRQWRHLSGTWLPNELAAFLQPDAFPNNKGIGSSHTTEGSFAAFSVASWRDHAGKFAVAYQAPWGMRLATSYHVQSGLWSSPIVTRLAAADPRFGPQTVLLSTGVAVPNPLATPLRFAFSTRGEGQFTSSVLHIWNLRVAREFAFGRTRFGAGLDLFNVGNRGDDEGLASFANQTYNVNYSMGGSIQPPRAAQLTLRFTY